MNIDELIRNWREERDEVVYTFDIQAFKEFYKKWQGLGLYRRDRPLPSDEVIEITMRKIVCMIDNPRPDKLAEAIKWLKERGYEAEYYIPSQRPW